MLHCLLFCMFVCFFSSLAHGRPPRPSLRSPDERVQAKSQTQQFKGLIRGKKLGRRHKGKRLRGLASKTQIHPTQGRRLNTDVFPRHRSHSEPGARVR